MAKCKICEDQMRRIIDFGKMPIANGFLSKTTEDEFFYDLSVSFCSTCFMVQLERVVEPGVLFGENYPFFSSTSNIMAEHFKKIAEEIIETISAKISPFVVELGSNDGIMLKHIAARGINHVGIEPSRNVAAAAKKNGVSVLQKFFNEETAKEIVNEHGQADVVCGSNVMCHIEDINSVFVGVNVLLKKDGVFFFEDPYLLDIVKKSSFDQIYDEHVYYFSGLSISELAGRHNLYLVDMIHQDVHGGSMRYYIKKNNLNNKDRVRELVSGEKSSNLHRLDGYLNFKGNVDRVCNNLKNTLLEIRKAGNRIVGYGATSKSTTLLNYARIGPDIIDYISDITPIKIDKYTPGTHIPIKSHDFFLKDNHKYTLLFAWNHKEEILKKEKAYREKGGKFITYFPRISIE